VSVLPAGFSSIDVIERTDRVEVHRARRGDETLLVAIAPTTDRDDDVRFRDRVRAIGSIEGVWIDGARAIAWRPREPIPLMKRPLLDALAVLEPASRVLMRHRHGALSPARISTAGIADIAAATTMGLPRTPEYSAPEQLDAGAADLARVDVYALALLFIAHVIGGSPWTDDRDLYVRAHDRRKRPSLAAHGVAASPAIDRVLERALAVDAELRYADVGAFWEALRAAVLAEPSTDAEPPRPRPTDSQPPPATPPPRAPASIVIGACVAIVAVGLGAEAGLRALRKPATPIVPSSVVAVASTPPAPSPSPSVSAKPVVVEPPKEMVLVDTFFIDRTEVTVKAFRPCVAAGSCRETYKRGSGWSPDDPVRSQWVCNYHRKDREDHPINCISFTNATNYCAFVGKRLPTGDEWTRAARGDTQRKYPWGDSNPRCKEVVFARYGPDLPGCNKQPVGTQPADAHPTDSKGGSAGVLDAHRPMNASPFGALDMGGSLWEWTTETSPRGLPILRGGAWDSSEPGVTIESRLEQSPGNGDITLGFRCAKDQG
jgi:formylglycine-generating enzyme required for sulfatase activity